MYNPDFTLNKLQMLTSYKIQTNKKTNLTGDRGVMLLS